MDSCSSSHSYSLEHPNSRRSKSMDHPAFMNLNLDISNLEIFEAEKSPTSVVMSPGSSNEFDSPKAETQVRDTVSEPPSTSGAICEQYIMTNVEIGRGKCGFVTECLNQFTGEIMACKSVDKTQMKPKGKRAKALKLEAKLSLGLSNHPNIVKCHGVYESAQNVHFIMEKCRGGDLFDLITEKGRLTEQESARILRKIGSAVAFCHSKGVVHRDIKPENILISDDHPEMEPKLGDFGEAFVMSRGKYPVGLVGTPLYMAPEIIMGLPHGFAVDVWSLGILLYIMLSGLLPYHGSTPRETFEFILAYEPNFSLPPWANVSHGAKSLVRKMLTKDPMKRLTVQDVLNDPWLNLN